MNERKLGKFISSDWLQGPTFLQTELFGGLPTAQKCPITNRLFVFVFFLFFFLPDSYFTHRFNALGIDAVSEEFLRLRFLWTLTKRWSRLYTDSSASLCTRVSVCLAFST